MTPTEFLLARIAEKEAMARHSLDGDLEYLPSLTTKHGDVLYLGVTHPTRVLAECEAERKIVNAVRSGFPDEDRYSTGWHDMHIWAITRLASVYSDHPDYQQEWKP